MPLLLNNSPHNIFKRFCNSLAPTTAFFGGGKTASESKYFISLIKWKKETNKKFLIFFLIILLCSSCTSKSEQANKNFLIQFKAEVKNINNKREIAAQPTKDSNATQLNNDDLPAQSPPQNITNKLPQDMFIISYNLYNFPDSYGNARLSFDDIKIPDSDIFGIKTKLGEKNYQLIDNQTLQKNIDFTNQLNTDEDKQISLKLIRQEKKIRRNNAKTR